MNKNIDKNAAQRQQSDPPAKFSTKICRKTPRVKDMGNQPCSKLKSLCKTNMCCLLAKTRQQLYNQSTFSTNFSRNRLYNFFHVLNTSPRCSRPPKSNFKECLSRYLCHNRRHVIHFIVFEGEVFSLLPAQ